MYIEFRDRENGWFRLRTGRRELQFGAQRLVGISDWSNTGRVFDGVRLTLAHNGASVDVFSTSVVVNHPTSFDNHLGGMTFRGVHGSFSRAVLRATVEPYTFWRTANTVKSLEGKLGNESEFTLGLRWAGKLPLGFDYAAEAARQAGHFSNDTIYAWAGYGIAGHSPSLLLSSRAFPRNTDTPPVKGPIPPGGWALSICSIPPAMEYLPTPICLGGATSGTFAPASNSNPIGDWGSTLIITRSS